MDKLHQGCGEVGLRINVAKTEVMGITKRRERLMVNLNIEGAALYQVDKFRYLGSLVSEDGRCDDEIRARIGMAKSNFGSMRRILTNMSLGGQL